MAFQIFKGTRRTKTKGPTITVYPRRAIRINAEAAAIAGITVGDFVTVYFDAEENLVAFAAGGEEGSARARHAAGKAVQMSLASFFRLHPTKPGRYPAERFEHDGRTLVGFRLSGAF